VEAEKERKSHLESNPKYEAATLASLSFDDDEPFYEDSDLRRVLAALHGERVQVTTMPPSLGSVE